MTAISDRDQLSYIAAQAADARVNVELETEGMTLNIGPQHPATHGTLRIVSRFKQVQARARVHRARMACVRRRYNLVTATGLGFRPCARRATVHERVARRRTAMGK